MKVDPNSVLLALAGVTGALVFLLGVRVAEAKLWRRPASSESLEPSVVALWSIITASAIGVTAVYVFVALEKWAWGWASLWAALPIGTFFAGVGLVQGVRLFFRFFLRKGRTPTQ